MKFYGRTEEIAALQKHLDLVKETAASRMVVVYGRRRVGKTTLVNEAFRNVDVTYLYFFVAGSGKEELMARWKAKIVEVFGLKRESNISSLADFIAWVMELSEHRPVVLVFDECQELEKHEPGFYSALQNIWDQNKNTSQTLLILSGSVLSAIKKIFGDHSEPLFGRPDDFQRISAFPVSVIREIAQDFNPELSGMDLLLTYAATGGVARYLELLAPTTQFRYDDILNFIFGRMGGTYRDEADIYLNNEFRAESHIYQIILWAIAQGRTKRSEIQDVVKNTNVSPYLQRLEIFGLIKRIEPFGSRTETKHRFEINDLFLKFWRLFVMGNCDDINQNQGARVVRRITPLLPEYLGHVLEQWFRQELLESGRWDAVGAWWDRKGEHEIDLIAVDEIDKRILFGEAKLDPKKFNEIKLRMKAEAFLQVNPQYRSWSMFFRGFSPEDMLKETPSIEERASQ